MATKWRFLTLALVFILPLGVTLLSKDVATAPNSVELICQVDSVSTGLANQNIVIPVYMTNIYDSVSGFELWVNSDIPDWIKFKVHHEAGGVIYGTVDTVGGLCGGFKWLEARILDPLHGTIKISGLCDPDSPRVVKPIRPGSGLLLKIIAQTNPLYGDTTLGDSLCDSTNVVKFVRSETRFSDASYPPELIGCNYYLHIDTVYSNCMNWVIIGNDTICTSWGDTTYVERWYCQIDTLKRVLLDGKTVFSCCQCGDANGDAAIDISDAVFLIQFIFAGGPPPGDCRGYTYGNGDANGDAAVDISDAVYLIQYIFAGGPAPVCP